MIRELQFNDGNALIKWFRQMPQTEKVDMTTEQASVISLQYGNSLVQYALDSGCSFVAVENNEIIGAALGCLIPHIWNPNTVDLVLLCVQSENRITAGKLFKKWLDKAEQMSNVDRILVDSIEGTNFNYNKLGFREMRTTYIKETSNE